MFGTTFSGIAVVTMAAALMAAPATVVTAGPSPISYLTDDPAPAPPPPGCAPDSMDPTCQPAAPCICGGDHAVRSRCIQACRRLGRVGAAAFTRPRHNDPPPPSPGDVPLPLPVGSQGVPPGVEVYCPGLPWIHDCRQCLGDPAHRCWNR